MNFELTLCYEYNKQASLSLDLQEYELTKDNTTRAIDVH
jgi:hypothetical protein